MTTYDDLRREQEAVEAQIAALRRFLAAIIAAPQAPCPACGLPMPADYHYCDACGARLGGAE